MESRNSGRYGSLHKDSGIASASSRIRTDSTSSRVRTDSVSSSFSHRVRTWSVSRYQDLSSWVTSYSSRPHTGSSSTINTQDFESAVASSYATFVSADDGRHWASYQNVSKCDIEVELDNFIISDGEMWWPFTFIFSGWLIFLAVIYFSTIYVIAFVIIVIFIIVCFWLFYCIVYYKRKAKNYVNNESAHLIII
ncbi:unnamed protein product [Meganyctiphanes norvegica]|uniref:Uncharacterized protein n=1 Tax=Meganyctiphanes norvegica TaxID=48144 RepID=A0AAV2SLF7_MEGNR